MEQKVFSKFNLYDQIGYLMVGAIVLFLFVFDGAYLAKQADVPPFDLSTFLVWFIVAYFLGHLIQGIANLISDTPLLRYLISENKQDFSEGEKEILQQAKNYFNLEKQSEGKLWNVCYMFASAKDITGQVQAFNAYYSLYRGWFVSFILESVFLFCLLLSGYNPVTLVLLIISIFLAFIFCRRAKRFWQYTRSKVLETFVVVKTLKL